MSDAKDTQRLEPVNITALCVGVPAEWLLDEVRAGRIPCLRAGRSILLDPKIVAEVLRARMTTEVAHA